MFKELNILQPFLEDPTREYSVRELAKLIDVSPATASTKLKLFAKKGILTERKERMHILYKGNSASAHFLDIKRFVNVRKVKESGIIDILDKFYLKPTIVLFGSVAKGEDDKGSDIDLLIISEKEGKPDLLAIEKKMKKTIQLFVVKKITDVPNIHLRNNMINGLTLQGGIKWT